MSTTEDTKQVAENVTEDESKFINKKNMPWLISDADLRFITNNYEYDWVMMKFLENGMICPEDAFWKIYFNRFEYYDKDCAHCEIKDDHTQLGHDCWKCKNCKKVFTTTSGTYLANTNLEYHHWWRFCYLIGKMKITNSNTVAKDLGVTQKTAWNMLNTLRIARKETTKTPFVNGAAVFDFENMYEVLEVLLMKKKQKPLKVIEVKMISLM